MITKLYAQPDDDMSDRTTLTVNYFVRDWQNMGHTVVVMHTSSRFPLLLYLLPAGVKKAFAGHMNTNVPPLASRKPLVTQEGSAKVYRLPMLKMMPFSAYSSHAMEQELHKIEAILKELSFTPDLILGHFANPAAQLTARLAERYGVPSSVVFHQDAFPENARKYDLPHWIPRLGAVGARSPQEALQLREQFSLPRMPFVCYSGVPDEAAAGAEPVCTRHKEGEGLGHLYVGRLIPRKFADTVIRAFCAVARPEDSLHIVGDGSEGEALRELAEKLDTRRQITFTKQLSRSQVLAEMKRAQVFTMISRDEAFGMVYLEAMLQGCLVIATKGGAFDGVIREGENGFLCEAGNEEMLQGLYRRIAAMSGTEKNRIASAAVQTALNYTDSAVAKRYLEDALSGQKK